MRSGRPGNARVKHKRALRRLSCLLVCSLRMRSTAVGVRMRAALPRVRTCAHGIFVSRRWRGSAPLNVGQLNVGLVPFMSRGSSQFHDEFHGWRREGACRGRRPDAFKCQRSTVRKSAASARLGRQAPHARSCSAHSHSDHYAMYAQAGALHTSGHDLRGRCARACCARWPRRPQRKSERAALTPGRRTF